jgi:hypothetical protein
MYTYKHRGKKNGKKEGDELMTTTSNYYMSKCSCNAHFLLLPVKMLKPYFFLPSLVLSFFFHMRSSSLFFLFFFLLLGFFSLVFYSSLVASWRTTKSSSAIICHSFFCLFLFCGMCTSVILWSF